MISLRDKPPEVKCGQSDKEMNSHFVTILFHAFFPQANVACGKNYF